jgi:hypothetical protein
MADIAVFESDDILLSLAEPVDGRVQSVISLNVIVFSRVFRNLSVQKFKGELLLSRNVIFFTVSLGS